jgi:hypothetical protein
MRVGASVNWIQVAGADILSAPTDVAYDDRGYLYISDTGNNRIVRLRHFAPPRVGVVRTGDQTGPTMTWSADAGWRYTVRYTDDLLDAVWHDLPGCVDLPGIDGPMSVTDPESTRSSRFYRVLAR